MGVAIMQVKFFMAIIMMGGLSVKGVSLAAAAETITWSSYEWRVRSSGGAAQGPGPNIFSDSHDNVFVDAKGDLHLRITQREDKKWVGSEIDLTRSLGHGTYQWEVSYKYDQYTSNVVVGLFTYLSPRRVAQQTGGVVGNGKPDTPHEIDIEFTGAWGETKLFFTTHDPDIKSPGQGFLHAPVSDLTTHRFCWTPKQIVWESFAGHISGDTEPLTPLTEQRAGPNQGKPVKYVYEGPVIPKDLDEIPIINFWMFGDEPSTTGPVGGKPQELIIHSFKFTPLTQPQ